jgi:hypothetical protein
MIYESIDTASQLRDRFQDYGRYGTFTYEAYDLIFDYLDSMDGDLELDVIALCCEINEAHWTDVAEDYEVDLSEIEDADDQKRAVIDYVQDNTAYIGETNEGNLVYFAF